VLVLKVVAGNFFPLWMYLDRVERACLLFLSLGISISPLARN
jgi:hypothetical protein